MNSIALNVDKLDTIKPMIETSITSLPRKLWLLWLIVSFFYAFQYLLRVSPSVMMSCIINEFGISNCDFGDFSGAYYLGYALMHIPIGMLLDRLQLRWVLAGSILMSVTGLLPLIYSTSWSFSVLGRFLVGAGSSGAILSLFTVTQNFFPERLFSRLLGIGVTIGLLGAIYGGGPVDHISQQWGWQNVLLVFFVVGVALSLAVLILTPNNPVRINNKLDDSITLGRKLIIVLTSKRVMLTALFAALMVGPIEGFADVWALPFLETVYQYDRQLATSLPPLIFLGMCIGSPLLSAIAEKYKIYNGIIISSAIVMAIIFIILVQFQPSTTVVSILFVTVGIFSAYQVLVMYLNSKNLDAQYGSLVTAVTNMIVMSFGSVFHYIIPKTMDLVLQDRTNGWLDANQIEAYCTGIGVIPIFMLLALCGLTYLKIQQLKQRVQK